MSGLLAEYEARLRRREHLLMSEKTSLQENEISNLKFTPDGEIKPFYGLTCITWMDEKSELYSILMGTQRSIQAKFKTAGVDQNFFFLEPASFHMTICDITASSTPIVRAEIETVCNQIQDAFSDGLQVESIQAQVRGLGLTSTITALVRFQQESELEKALLLENQIKNATQSRCTQFSWPYHPGLLREISANGYQENPRNLGTLPKSRFWGVHVF